MTADNILPPNSTRKARIAATTWNAMVEAYGQGGRTRCEIPFEEAVDVLLSLAANVISQAPTPGDRQRLMRDVMPKLDRLVNAVRGQPDPSIWSRGKNLVVPH